MPSSMAWQTKSRDILCEKIISDKVLVGVVTLNTSTFGGHHVLKQTTSPPDNSEVEFCTAVGLVAEGEIESPTCGL